MQLSLLYAASLYWERYENSERPCSRLVWQRKYDPSTGLDTRKLLQVIGRRGSRGVMLSSWRRCKGEKREELMARGNRGCLEWRNGWKFLSCKVINYRQPLTNTLPSFAGLLASSVLASCRFPGTNSPPFPLTFQGRRFLYFSSTLRPFVFLATLAANLSGFIASVPFRPWGFSSCIKLLSSLILFGFCANHWPRKIDSALLFYEALLLSYIFNKKPAYFKAL